ncbi:MAG: protein kinase domain-containing protein [Candidatus Promineifilaceae bacterium]
MGEVIDHYRLEELLGDGGMGSVFRATDLNLERTMALKIMHDHFGRLPEFRARLLQEARAAAQLDHPSIIKIYDFGEDDGSLYVAMEHISGGNLRAHLSQLQNSQRFLPIGQSLKIGIQLAEALDYAHRQGVVHRDVKPGNIILKPLQLPADEGGLPFRAILTDFGLVKLLEGEAITESGVTLGTPAYMSPEQCEGRSLDGRSDLYSLGVLLYELLSNQLPFAFKSLAEAAAAHARGVLPRPLREARPDLPPALASVVMKALAKDPAGRYASGQDMAEALRSAAKALDADQTQIDVLEPTAKTPAEERPAVASLTIETPGHPAEVARLAKDTVTIGRSLENDVVLPDDHVSRYHVRLQRMRGRWRLLDLETPNGTSVNGEPAPKGEAIWLDDGAQIEIGPYRLVFKGPPSATADEPTALWPAVAPPPAGEPSLPAERPPLEAFLVRDNVAVEPGRQAEFTLEVVNRGQEDDRVGLRVHGLPDEWVSLPDTFLPLPAGGSVSVPIVIRPPRQTTTAAGRQRFRIEVVSQRWREAELGLNAALLVGGFESFEAELEPREVRLPGQVLVTLRNTGNTPVELSVTGDEALDAVLFEGERSRLRLGPGQAWPVELVLRPAGRSWFGRYQTSEFEIEVSSETGARVTLTGVAQSAPLLPMGVAYGAIFVVVFLCALSGLILLIQRDRLGFGQTGTPGAANALTATAISALQTIGVSTQTAATGTAAAATAAVAGDRDRDGLSDAQEAVLGSNPDVADSDGDGLLDGEEVLTWATNPLKLDTDSDGLSDGDEVRQLRTSPLQADSDGDGLADGVEVSLGSNPLDPLSPLPTATPQTAVPTATPSVTPTPAAATATGSPTPTPSLAPSQTPSLTPTPTPTPSATATSSATPTASPTPSPTSGPALAVGCMPAAPTVDGVIQVTEWAGAPLLIYDPEGDTSRRVIVYLRRDAANLYLASVVNDPNSDESSDGLRVQFDANNNAGDPDSADRAFAVARDGASQALAGLGSNSDNADWDATYASPNWVAAAGMPAASLWALEMQINAAAELPALAAGDPFSTLLVVDYSDGQRNWPVGGVINDAGTWQEIQNANCGP